MRKETVSYSFNPFSRNLTLTFSFVALSMLHPIFKVSSIDNITCCECTHAIEHSFSKTPYILELLRHECSIALIEVTFPISIIHISIQHF